MNQAQLTTEVVQTAGQFGFTPTFGFRLSSQEAFNEALAMMKATQAAAVGTQSLMLVVNTFALERAVQVTTITTMRDTLLEMSDYLEKSSHTKEQREEFLTRVETVQQLARDAFGTLNPPAPNPKANGAGNGEEENDG